MTEIGKAAASDTRRELIDRAALIPPVWNFGRARGHALYDGIRFMPDGRVLGSKHPNERFWRFEDGKLLMLDAAHEPTTAFDRIEIGPHGPVLTGPFLRGREGEIIVHRMEPNRRDLHVEMSLRGFDRPLLVIFNSHGRAFDRHDTRWEFWELPRSLQLNHVRLAERVDPHFWFTNKTARIVGLLSAVIEQGFERVVLCGLSSGGYAAHLFAELLAVRCPGRRFGAISINPQTGLLPAHADRLRLISDRDYRPALIEPDALAQSDAPATELRDLIGRGSDVDHTVFFDEGNPVERHYCAQIAGLPGVDLKSEWLGLNHPDGIARIFSSSQFKNTIHNACV